MSYLHFQKAFDKVPHKRLLKVTWQSWENVQVARKLVYKGLQRNTKEEQTATVLLELTSLSMRLHFTTIVSTCYYYCIYMLETKGQQIGSLLPITPSSSRGWPEEAIPCSMEKLVWTLYRKN